MTHSTSAKLPKEIATKILDRAANLDGTDERIDLATLRSAALDAGISPDAFERALVESMTAAPQRTREPEPPRLNFYETAIKTTVAGVIGATVVIAPLAPFATWLQGTWSLQPSPPGASLRACSRT
jgi:hypothetical protein